MTHKTLTTLLAIVAMTGFSMQAQAETRFNGTIDTAWTNAANWSAGVPTAILQARLQAAKTADIDSVAVAGGLNFRGSGTPGASIINVNAGGSLTSDGSDFSGNNRVGSSGDATLNINDGGSANFSGTGIFEVGESGGGDTGYVNVYTGGVLTVSQEAQLGVDGSTLGSLLVDGGTAVFSNVLAVGQAATSTGSVTMTSGSMTFEGTRLEMTDNTSAVATFNMTGGTITHTGEEMQVGRDGLATFTQSGGEITAKGIYVGHLKTATGSMIMTGGTNVLSGALTLGNQGDGTSSASGSLNMSGGSMVVGTLEVGASVGTTGIMTMSGVDTYLKASTLRLGDAGVDASSSITVNDGEFQIHAILSDSNNTQENLHLAGGVLKLRHISGATGFSNAVDLIDAGVITWTNGAVGSAASLRNAELATMSWTNGMGTILYADTRTNNTHYYYMWAEADQPVPTFSDWTDDYGMTNSNTYADDYDGDLLDNLAEYALGGNPTNGFVEGGILPAFETLDDGSTNWFYYVYNRHTDYVDRSLAYDVLNVDNLVSGTWTNDYELAVGISAPFTGSLGDEFESVTNRISMEGQSAEFTQLEIMISE
ncbi:hypothetical protein [Pontiella sulfatireligans]|uniref:Autotransporter domain-containing protein n=1 Tax=Pontiella sulfatireligans TaxID=2750658 RepID=A0A6C2USU8_9BACT|nr:hypothetical protein [Pontiella sulfatireligans]VGO22331.1 hypothetical protein SCARR_04414 [Pontiella sulfatireligans]